MVLPNVRRRGQHATGRRGLIASFFLLLGAISICLVFVEFGLMMKSLAIGDEPLEPVSQRQQQSKLRKPNGNLGPKVSDLKASDEEDDDEESGDDDDTEAEGGDDEKEGGAKEGGAKEGESDDEEGDDEEGDDEEGDDNEEGGDDNEEGGDDEEEVKEDKEEVKEDKEEVKEDDQSGKEGEEEQEEVMEQVKEEIEDEQEDTETDDEKKGGNEADEEEFGKLINDKLLDEYDVCIVGAGLSGAVIAERYANELKKTVFVMEKRDHIGGNCYDFIDPETNIRISKYGAHLFHTKYKRVWDYVQQWSPWTKWEHEVVAKVGDKHVPVPVNIKTVNTLFDLDIKNSEEMDEWLAKEQVKYDEPKNSEEMAKSRVGPRLYELIFKPYTIKQWAKDPSELGPEVTARIPVRNNFDGRYFSDPYQALPSNGYTAIFEKMFDNPLIKVRINTDFFEIRDSLKCGRTYFTGPIDAYFAHLGWDKLEYRSLDFERKVEKNSGFFQPNSVVNHPSSDVNFTRIVEYKHFLNQTSDHTVYFIERSKDHGEPYYPVPNPKNKALFAKYQEMSTKEPNVSFVGRLANYKYFNMDESILNALELFDKDTAGELKSAAL